MRRKIGIIVILLVAIMGTLILLNRHPIVSCDIPTIYMDAVKDQARGVYSQRLPLVPVYVRINQYEEGVLYYTIYYFPVGSVGMSYIGGDGYNIEKSLTNM